MKRCAEASWCSGSDPPPVTTVRSCLPPPQETGGLPLLLLLPYFVLSYVGGRRRDGATVWRYLFRSPTSVKLAKHIDGQAWRYSTYGVRGQTDTRVGDMERMHAVRRRLRTTVGH